MVIVLPILVTLNLAVTTVAGLPASSCGVTRVTSGADRVLGGREALTSEYPWLVSLQRNYYGIWRHECTASIIHPRLLLTAAHCRNYYGPRRRAVAGCRNRGVNRELVCQIIEYDDSDDITDHAGYEEIGRAFTQDVAVVRLKRPFLYTNETRGAVGPICLPDPSFPVLRIGDKVSAAGWGVTRPREAFPSPADYVFSVPLKTVQLQMFDPDICWRRYYNDGYTEDDQLCVGSMTNNTDICNGDSGGPLMLRHEGRVYAMGIASYKQYCGRAGNESTTAYERVQSYLRWIHHQLQKTN